MHHKIFFYFWQDLNLTKFIKEVIINYNLWSRDMETKKVLKKSAGGLLISAGCLLKLADWGLSASEVVLNGGKNMADSFAKAPELGIGSSLFKATHKGIQTLGAYALKKGKGFVR